MGGRTTNVLDIRELIRHLREGSSGREIHAAMGLGRRTVAKYRAWAEAEGFLEGPLPDLEVLQARQAGSTKRVASQVTSTVTPYQAEVEQLLREGVEVEAIRQRLLERHGFQGSYMMVWRFVQKLGVQKPDVTVRVETKPGEELQVDFGYADQMWEPAVGALRKTWAFVATLSWSRHQFVKLVGDQTVVTWLQCHREAFEFFGGVPKRVKLDNLKAGVVVPDLDDPEIQRAYRECAEHYGFLISPCRVRKPEHKGKVEKGGVHYVKRNFLAGQHFTSPQRHRGQANEAARRWCLEVAGRRRHGTTKQVPLECFERTERVALQPLPATPFEPVAWKTCKLHRDCYVVFENAYYSAPHRLIGENLAVRATAKTIEIYRGIERVAVHSRATRAGERLTLMDHLPAQKAAGLTLTPDVCLARAQAIGPATHQVVREWLADPVVDRLRAAQRLLRHDPVCLETVCTHALQFGELSPKTLARLLTRGIPKTSDPLTSAPLPTTARYARSITDLLPLSLTQRLN